MADSLSFSRTDIRSAAVDHKRERASKKWSPRWSCGIDASRVRPDGSKRPGRLQSSSAASICRKDNEKRLRADHTATKRDVLLCDPDLPSDDHSDASSFCSSPNDEIFYSYDAPTGPKAGADVLSEALTRAVERFEDGQTAKLVKEEYDVLEVSETVDKSANDASHLCDDDDFEFV